MSKRWARVSLCALALSAFVLLVPAPVTPGLGARSAEVGTAAAAEVGTVGAAVGAPAAQPALSLASQTPWVSPAAPWFSLSVAAGNTTGPIAALHVELTFYNRIDDATEMTQATYAVPNKGVITHFNEPLTAGTDGGVASTCTTILRNAGDTPPPTVPPNTTACPAGSHTVILGCVPDDGTCGDVYPVSVALYRQGTAGPLGRFTTFLTYQEPNVSSSGGSPLRVGLVVPVAARLAPGEPTPASAALEEPENVTSILAAHRGVPVSVAANPATVSALETRGAKKGRRAIAQLQALTAAPIGGDELLAQPYVPIDVAALTAAGLTGEIGAQMARGNALLAAAGLHPTPRTWADTSTDESADVADLGAGLQAVAADRLIIDDADLAPAGSDILTFAQPFSLATGQGRHVTAAGADNGVDALFTAEPDDPVLAANQMIATLEFVHFENPYERDARGIVMEPPESWQPSDALLSTLLTEMAGNPVLAPVTVDQFFAQVPEGGNGEPATRRLASAPATSDPSSAPASAPATASATFTKATARHFAEARAHLTSFTKAVGGHPPVLVALSDLLLASENETFDPAQRAAAFATFVQRLGTQVNLVSLAAQNTITFTSRTAAIPVSVLSSAPYPVTVVVSLNSDKFAFPDGNTRTLTLNRPTTPVRIEARAVTSGDRLPVDVTLTTPDGALVIARAALTVHSTSISIVGVALTVVAALVLVVWWARTWRRGRRKRPRAV